MPTLFPKQPTLTKKDETRLREDGYLDGWNKLNRILKEKKPGADDLKRLTLMEVESEAPRLPILEKLIVQVQKHERRDIFKRIRAHRPDLSKL
jgi:hypothetical protein